MMLVPCYLAPSLIEGLGVFSSAHIKKGDVIWRFDPRFDQLIRRDDIAAAPAHVQEFFERYTYEMPDYPDCVVLDADEGRFMNHSDRPNADFSSHDVGIATRDIPAGEEITCDYRVLESRELVFQGPRHKLARNGAVHA